MQRFLVGFWVLWLVLWSVLLWAALTTTGDWARLWWTFMGFYLAASWETVYFIGRASRGHLDDPQMWVGAVWRSMRLSGIVVGVMVIQASSSEHWGFVTFWGVNAVLTTISALLAPRVLRQISA